MKLILVFFLAANALCAESTSRLDTFISGLKRSNFKMANSSTYEKEGSLVASLFMGENYWLESMTVQIFLKKTSKEVKQLRISSKRCNNSKIKKSDFKKWERAQIKNLYESFFSRKAPSSLFIDEGAHKQLSGEFRKFKTQKKAYKCDGHGGDGLGLDFYF